MYESLKVAPTLYYVLNFTHTEVKTETEHIFYIYSRYTKKILKVG